MGEGFKIQRQTPTPPVIDTNVYLYKDGDEKAALTGGWAKAFFAGASSTYTENANNIAMTAVGASGSGADMSTATANLINLTNYTKLKMKFSGSLSNANSLIGLDVLSAKNTYFPSIAVAKVEKKLVQTYTDTIIELDVTALNSSYYIGAEVYKSGITGTTETLTVKQVWLEV